MPTCTSSISIIAACVTVIAMCAVVGVVRGSGIRAKFKAYHLQTCAHRFDDVYESYIYILIYANKYASSTSFILNTSQHQSILHINNVK